MKKRQATKLTMTKIIRSSRDGRADYELPLARAKELYTEGKLHWDSTNGAYCHPDCDPHQPKLS